MVLFFPYRFTPSKKGCLFIRPKGCNGFYMKTIRKVSHLKEELNRHRKDGKTIGFVPTMGALHPGHMSLLGTAKAENDLLVCSIFVNPIQFNEEGDLDAYPRPLEQDQRLLLEQGCHILFLPGEGEMYPDKPRERYDFGRLDKVMEGEYRPGHFNGVAIVVHRLLKMVAPHRAYFGEKDFQQLQVINKLVEMTGLGTRIVAVPTSREADGLARSSRNARLTPEQRKAAPLIYKVLKEAKDRYLGFTNPKQLEKWATEVISSNVHLRPQYVRVVDINSLEKIEQWTDNERCILCVAVFAGDVRLIDNMRLFNK